MRGSPNGEQSLPRSESSQEYGARNTDIAAWPNLPAAAAVWRFLPGGNRKWRGC